MNTAAIILAAGGALILGMAGLLKAMVVSKLDTLQAAIDEIRSEIHDIDIRVTRLETEHRLGCPHKEGR